MPSRVRDARGFTLIELAVVILLLGIMATVASVAFRSDETDARQTLARQVAAARERAVDERRSTPFLLEARGRMVEGLALPDGRIVALDSALDVELLTGRPRAPVE